MARRKRRLPGVGPVEPGPSREPMAGTSPQPGAPLHGSPTWGPGQGAPGESPAATDRRGRALRDLRVSVTDRCNFRCTYCMPRDVFGPGFEFVPREELLTFEEIQRVASLFVRLGVEKVRITGGEPLLRRELERLVAMLAELEGVRDLTMTTNASLLPGRAEALRDVGLRRVTVSLDALDDEVFRAMSDVNLPVSRVLEGIDAASDAGLTPVKVNMVVKRGANDHQVERMAAHFRGTGHILRFIEYMDVGSTNGWRMEDVVPASEIHRRIHERWPLEPMEPDYPGEVATRYRYRDGAGEVGIISSVTRPFCATCTRARLTADGELFTCLFAADGHGLKDLLRSGASDDEILQRVRGIWEHRDDRYSELRTEATSPLPRVEMSRIGG